jgi:hypothetical protein
MRYNDYNEWNIRIETLIMLLQVGNKLDLRRKKNNYTGRSS